MVAFWLRNFFFSPTPLPLEFEFVELNYDIVVERLLNWIIIPG